MTLHARLHYQSETLISVVFLESTHFDLIVFYIKVRKLLLDKLIIT